MSCPKLISLVGLAGSGKGTVGELLSDHGYTKLAFADSLKDSVSSIFGWERSLLEGDTIESREFRECEDTYWSLKFDRKITPRKVLQEFGTDIVRNKYLSSIWMDSLERKLSLYDKVVVCDTRFTNEMVFLGKLGSIFIEIRRPEAFPNWYLELHNESICDKYQFMEINYPDVHISEWAHVNSSVLDSYNKIVILNDSTKEHLKDCVDRVLKIT